MYTVGFVLIPQVCPRSEWPVDSKGYCTVPNVQITLKNFKKNQVQQELAGWGSWVPLISIFGSHIGPG